MRCVTPGLVHSALRMDPGEGRTHRLAALWALRRRSSGVCITAHQRPIWMQGAVPPADEGTESGRDGGRFGAWLSWAAKEDALVDAQSVQPLWAVLEPKGGGAGCGNSCMSGGHPGARMTTGVGHYCRTALTLLQRRRQNAHTHTHTHTHAHGRRNKQGTAKGGLSVLDLVRCKAEQKQSHAPPALGAFL